MQLAVVSLTFENDSAISALRFSPARIYIAREENSARAEASVRLRSKIFAHTVNHEIQITARFFFSAPRDTGENTKQVHWKFRDAV